MIMMICGSGISALQDCLRGTVFEVWLARACGATVGKERGRRMSDGYEV